MKLKIIEILKASGSTVSGEALSQKLGVSRVSVWKHIKKLKESGYDIESGPKGYLIGKGSEDMLFPWEFPGREKTILYHDVADSTMDLARTAARKGCPHFTAVIAGRQEKGRGRLDRSWESSAGGLYFTLVLRPDIEPALSFRVNFAASLTLARILRNGFGINAQVKWPNDILVDEKKLVGMLSEMETRSDMLSFVNIGIGINVNNAPPEIENGAVSIKQITGGSPISRKKVLTLFLNAFEEKLNNWNPDTIISEWKEYTVTINRRVRIKTLHETTQGLAVDVDENGALVLELEDGTCKKIIYGDCFHDIA